MKKTIYLLFALLLLSCNKDEGNKDHVIQEEFFDIVGGRYEMRVATTDTPIDLNHDGVLHTDLYKEVVYCNFSLLFNSFTCRFQHRSTYNQIVFDVPASEWVGPKAGTNTCLRSAELAYDFKVDAKTREVMLVQSDYWDDFATGFHTEILDLHWKNGRAYFKFRKRFRISPNETKWVILYLEYEKVGEYG